jgi:hypothetical protein
MLAREKACFDKLRCCEKPQEGIAYYDTANINAKPLKAKLRRYKIRERSCVYMNLRRMATIGN